ncbi:hypothetical protein [Streptomyces clavuligerus]|uniref:hypothetical protein n=1 Tax=Streptomyces clavuligerus TaxID=1901 RepID=UPI001F07A5A7|nr:hypothetical protein [Streptomyces clavuligerus]
MSKPRDQPELRTVVEGQVTVTPFAQIKAELLPPNLIGRFRGRARIAVDNLGNTPLTASLTVRDESNGLTFDLQPGAVQIGPGRARLRRPRVRPRRSAGPAPRRNTG